MLVEVATALLIVSGFMSLFLSLEAAISIAGSAEPDLVLLALFLFIGLGTIAVGIALRYGRWWLFGLNYVAVAAFLELTSGTAQGLLFGAIDLFVVVVLLTQRPWFAWKSEDVSGAEPADA